MGEAVKKHSAYREEDTVVPRAMLPDLVRAIKDVAARHGIRTICYGHAGDGNIHCNIVKSALSEQEWKTKLPGAVTELHKIVVAMGGTLSGEHGIGCLQNNHMPLAVGRSELELMKGIKKVFDPLGILNPGKVFPDNDVV
jgi:glycolate oxidase